MNFVTAKHMKTFSFPENRIFSGNGFTRTKHSLNMQDMLVFIVCKWRMFFQTMLIYFLLNSTD